MAKSTYEIIQGIIIEKLGVEPEKVVWAASFANDLGADSLDFVEIIMAIEDEFDISIPDDAAELLTTVGAMTEYVFTHPKDLDPVIITPGGGGGNPPIILPGGGGNPGGGNPGGGTVGGGGTTTPPPDPDVTLKTNFPCANKLVLGGLKGSLAYTEITAPFETGHKPDITWNISTTLPWGGTGNVYQMGARTPSASSFTGASSDIFLNSNMLNNASELMIATTVIHETYHARIGYDQANRGYSMPDYSKNSDMLDPDVLLKADLLFNTADLDSNYVDHYIMLSIKFDELVDVLYNYGGGRFTLTECRMAMLYGLEQAGPRSTPEEAADLNWQYFQIMAKYGFNPSTLNAFYLTQINAPAAKKLTKNCP